MIDNQHLDLTGPIPQNGNGLQQHAARTWDYRGILRRRWWIIAAAGVVAAGATLWSQSGSIDQYTAEVLIQRKSEAPLLSAPFKGDLALDDFGTQLEILRSRSVLGPVVDSLGLQVLLRTHQELRTDVIGAVEPAQQVRSARYSLSQQRGRLVLTQPRTGSIIATGNAETIRAPDFTLHVPDIEMLAEPVELSIRDRDVTIEQFERRVKVEQGKGADLIRLQYTHPDPRFAARVANATAESYRAYRAQAAREQAGRRRDVILKQLVHLADSVQAAQGVLLTYQQQSKLLDPQVEGNALMASRLQTENDLRTLRFQEGLLTSLVAGLRDGANDPEALQQLITLGANLVPAAPTLYQRLQDLQAERSRLTASRFGFTANDPRVQVVDSLIASSEQTIRLASSQALDMVKARLAEGQTRLGQLQGQIGSLPVRAAELTRLQQQVDGVQRVFDSLVQQYFEAEIAENSEAGDVNVIDPAHVPLWPDPTHDGLDLLIAIIVGLVIGVLCAAGVESLDGRVRTAVDAQRATRLTLLGTVPSFGSIGGRATSVLIVREAFRAIRTNLRFLGDPAPRVLVVTSPAPGEGKSTVSANLALTMVDQGARVLLIDADLRRPLIHTIFGTEAAPGLADVLGGTTSIEHAVRTSSLPTPGTLHILPSGKPGGDPARLLTSAAFEDLIRYARSNYDIVLLDTPPLLATVDTLPVATLADGSLVVVRANRTEFSSLGDAVEQLRRVNVALLGLIFNAVPIGHTPYRRYHEYYVNGATGRKREKRPLLWPAGVAESLPVRDAQNGSV